MKFTARNFLKSSCICKQIRTSWARCYAENFNKFSTKSFNHWSKISKSLWMSFRSISKKDCQNSFRNSLMPRWWKKKKKFEPLRMYVKRSPKSSGNSCTNNITVTHSFTIWDSEESILTMSLEERFGMLIIWAALGMVKPKNLTATQAEKTHRHIESRLPATFRMNQTNQASDHRMFLSFENTQTNRRKSLLSLRNKRHWQKEPV